MIVVAGLCVQPYSLGLPGVGTVGAPAFLMGLRKPSKLRPSMYEFPGGKVEASDAGGEPASGYTPHYTGPETRRIALAREWREELGVSIAVGVAVAHASFEIEELVEIYCYSVAFVERDPKPQPLDHTSIGWFDLEHAIRRMPCTPGTYLVYGQIKQWLRATGQVTP